jgi:hypothetical protein
VLVDGRGTTIRLGRTTGQTHDGQIAAKLLHRLRPRAMSIAEKAYDADQIRSRHAPHPGHVHLE